MADQEPLAEFPKCKFHPKVAPAGVIVKDPDEEAKLGTGWYDSPAEFPARAATSATADRAGDSTAPSRQDGETTGKGRGRKPKEE